MLIDDFFAPFDERRALALGRDSSLSQQVIIHNTWPTQPPKPKAAEPTGGFFVQGDTESRHSAALLHQTVGERTQR